MKRKVAGILMTVGFAGVCLATAQTSKVGSASTKPATDPVKNVTKPLTPKSAMPAKRKAAAPLNAPKAGNKTTAELGHLEKQNPKTTTPKKSTSAGTTKPLKSTDSSSAGSRINFKYQKPVAGKTAPTPSSKGSSTPRVKPH